MQPDTVPAFARFDDEDSTVNSTTSDYFAGDDQLHAATRRLRWASRSADRSRLLGIIGDHEMRRAGLHTAVFGTDPDAHGVPQREWMADSARMLWILAEAEHARAQHTCVPIQSREYLDRTDDRTLELQCAVDDILDTWVRGAPRRRCVRRMVAVWDAITRGQALEAPYCLGLRMPWWSR